jgi:hypothetical protein
MNHKILGLLTASLTAMPMLAAAQTETLDYQGYVMGGTSGLLPSGYTGFVNEASLITVSTTATFDAQVVVSGSVAQNDLSIVSYQVNVTGNNGSIFELTNVGVGSTSPILQPDGGVCYTGSFSVTGCVNLSVTGDAVTGATFDLASNWAKGSNDHFVIGPNGDSFSLTPGGSDIYCPGGPAQVGYVGSIAGAPCTMNVSNPTAGVWTAPEIDPASAASGLALLLGGLVVVRGRRTVETQAT